MKLPNGSGSVTRMKDTKRRKPYVARVTLGWTYENGKAKQNRKVIGSFRTKAEALQALAEYNTHPYDIDNKSITMQQLFDRWSEEYRSHAKNDRSANVVTSTWRYVSDIYQMRVVDVRTRHLKAAWENAYVIEKDGQKKSASPVVKTRLKTLMNLMCDYACEYEIMEKNYARLFGVPREVSEEMTSSTKNHLSFTEDEMNTLWSLSDDKIVSWILIQCYMGWRPQELVNIKIDNVDLESGTMVGGMKTAAGTNRVVPIHHRIMPLVERAYWEAVNSSQEYIFSDHGKFKYDQYEYRFNKVMSGIGAPQHKPHDPRKTFVTMAKKYGMDDFAIKRIVGHAINDITEAIYTDRDIGWIRSELEKLP